MPEPSASVNTSASWGECRRVPTFQHGGTATPVDPQHLRVAYLTSYYPAVSHSFIRREVLALREQGVDVLTFSIQAAHGADVLAPIDRAEMVSTQYIVSRSRTSLARELGRSLSAHPFAIATVAAKAVRSATGWRQRLWQLFYVGEAAILHRWLAEQGVHHVHAHFANAPADVARWTRTLGNRLGGSWTWSFTMHGPTEFYAVEENQLRAKLIDADFVACISDFCRSQLMVFSDPSDWYKLGIVHCGVVPEQFRLAKGGGSGQLQVLSVGRLVPEKGHTILLHAARHLDDMGVPVHLTIAGDGPYREALEKEASAIGVSATFLGPVSQDAVPELLADADVFCLPSFAEGLPVVLMEAMASALPVVTTRIAGIQELVEDNVSGFVIAPGRDDLLAEALAEIARDPERARRMGEAGRKKVCDEFDVSVSARTLKEIFSDLLSGSGTRRATRAPYSPQKAGRRRVRR